VGNDCEINGFPKLNGVAGNDEQDGEWIETDVCLASAIKGDADGNCGRVAGPGFIGTD